MWFKEMSEMRANHRRGIEINVAIAQNRWDGDPKRLVKCVNADRTQIWRAIGVKMA